MEITVYLIKSETQLIDDMKVVFVEVNVHITSRGNIVSYLAT